MSSPTITSASIALRAECGFKQPSINGLTPGHSGAPQKCIDAFVSVSALVRSIRWHVSGQADSDLRACNDKSAAANQALIPTGDDSPPVLPTRELRNTTLHGKVILNTKRQVPAAQRTRRAPPNSRALPSASRISALGTTAEKIPALRARVQSPPKRLWLHCFQTPPTRQNSLRVGDGRCSGSGRTGGRPMRMNMGGASKMQALSSTSASNAWARVTEYVNHRRDEPLARRLHLWCGCKHYSTCRDGCAGCRRRALS